MIALNSPVSLLPEPFDAFEIATCVEYADNDGGTYFDRVDVADDWDDNGPVVSLVVALYGHFPSGGVHSITDAKIVTGGWTFEDAHAYILRLAASMNPMLEVVDMSVNPIKED